MNINETILLLLQKLKGTNNTAINQYVHIDSKKTQIIIDSHPLITITTNTILLDGKINLQEKTQTPKATKDDTIFINSYVHFIDAISPEIIRLNHIGISYYVTNKATEINMYKNALEGSFFMIYADADNTNDVNQQWLFTGNTKIWQAPLFEIVLNTEGTNKEWIPHFQIDIDTKLSFEDVKKTTTEFFGKDFIKWTLSDTTYDTFLAMGILGQVDGVKVALGIGTNTRNIRYHREVLLDEVKITRNLNLS